MVFGVMFVLFDEYVDYVVVMFDSGLGVWYVVCVCYVVGVDGVSLIVCQLIGQDFKGKMFVEDWLIVDV